SPSRIHPLRSFLAVWVAFHAHAPEAITAARIWPTLSTTARLSRPRGLNSASAAKAAAAITAIDTRIVKIRQSMPRRALGACDPIAVPSRFRRANTRHRNRWVGTPVKLSSPRHFARVPLELGGAPRTVSNLSPERGRSPNPKDAAENAARANVCAGRMTLRQAQVAFIATWLGPYPRYRR